MLERDELKIAVEDARARQTALVQLMYFLDTQAMNFLRTYITIEAAAASAIVVAVKADWAFKPELIASLIGLFLTILLGSFFCFRTMETVTIMLPGRGPDFWVWGLQKDVEHDRVAAEYMKSLDETMTINRKMNARSSTNLKIARYCGLLAPFVALGAALVAFACPSVARLLS